MPEEQNKPLVCVDNLRHAEYYDMQKVFDELYAKSLSGEQFSDLMDIILSRENILLAYRNIKANTGSKTAGTDGLVMADIGKLSPCQVVEQVRFIIAGSPHGYRPRAVRRKDIPKPYDPTKTRPLGIPCIWDRLVQQCIKQVMEPICEGKFSNHSYGFRPNRSTEHAIAATYQKLHLAQLHHVIEFDIKGFFDNVNHSKLIKQIWAMGIHDKHLIWVIKRILTARIKMPDGTFVTPTKGTPQGGIISPLLANIVLNELDHWVDSQWINHPQSVKRWNFCENGRPHRAHAYKTMRKTNLKEMYIVRYADDFRIFCRTKTEAKKVKTAVTQWLAERLRLEISEEKTRIVNVKRKFMEFLGFKIKVHSKGQKYVVKSHMSDKQREKASEKLVRQAKRIAAPPKGSSEQYETHLYNSMVMGIQNYYRIATNVSVDCGKINRRVMTVLTNRLRTQTGSRLVKTGRNLTEVERKRYGQSKMLRYVAGSEQPIYPIGYIRHKNPMGKRRDECPFTAEGRKGLHDNLRINMSLLLQLMQQPPYDRSVEYADNRISMFSAQWGKCAVTGVDFQTVGDIHCHHKTPRRIGGNDKYENLVLVLKQVHKLIHATQSKIIDKYLVALNIDHKSLGKINELRKMAELPLLTFCKD